MSGWNGTMDQAGVHFLSQWGDGDGAILAHWKAGCDTLSIARELCLPESVVFNRLFHAREDRRRTSEWIDRAMGSSS